jgi:hypothetical protein
VHATIGLKRKDIAPFFNEAIADVYGGVQTRFGATAPSGNDGTSWLTADRRTGQHFIRWLRERWGLQSLARLVHAGSQTFAEFDDIYGMSIEDAEAIYFEDAPFGYPSMVGCDGPDLIWDESGSKWYAQLNLSCETEDDTRAAGAGMFVHRTFVVEEPGFYSISTDAYWFDIFRCSPERIEQPPDSTDWLDDAPVAHAGYPSPSYRHYEGGGVHDLFLEAGTHDIGIGLLGHDAGVAHIAIWPTLGPQPGNWD